MTQTPQNLTELIEEEQKKMREYRSGESMTPVEFVTIVHNEILPTVIRRVHTPALNQVREAVEAARKDIPGRMEHLKRQGLSKTNRIRRRKESQRYNDALEDIATLINNLKEL